MKEYILTEEGKINVKPVEQLHKEEFFYIVHGLVTFDKDKNKIYLIDAAEEFTIEEVQLLFKTELRRLRYNIYNEVEEINNLIEEAKSKLTKVDEDNEVKVDYINNEIKYLKIVRDLKEEEVKNLTERIKQI